MLRAYVIAPLAAAALALGGCGAGEEEEVQEDAAAELPGSSAGWSTDFSRHSVPLDEFVSGGPPKDGIPAIDEPRFVDVAAADSFLGPSEPVAVLERDGDVQAYPIQILVWHEIVNSEIAGEPVAVTYCPLCNSTVAFSREVDGRTLDFGTTGRLRSSDLVMYDRQTESWWQQLTAEAVVGELTGAKLEVIPSQILSWEQLRRAHPDARVISRNTGFDRNYGANPYAGYDEPDSAPFLLDGTPDRRLPPKERVTSVRTGDGAAVVYPFSTVAETAPVDDMIGGVPIVVLFDPEVSSALDQPTVAAGRAVGAAAVFERRAGGRELSFEPGPDPGTARDRETGSIWDITGRATSGPLQGAELRQIPSDDQFWFAIAAFVPDVEIRGGSGGGSP